MLVAIVMNGLGDQRTSFTHVMFLKETYKNTLNVLYNTLKKR